MVDERGDGSKQIFKLLFLPQFSVLFPKLLLRLVHSFFLQTTNMSTNKGRFCSASQGTTDICVFPFLSLSHELNNCLHTGSGLDAPRRASAATLHMSWGISACQKTDERNATLILTAMAGGIDVQQVLSDSLEKLQTRGLTGAVLQVLQGMLMWVLSLEMT